ncbi:MAG: hypothetical protein V4664_01250 [Patescibacteria group bacterium]
MNTLISTASSTFATTIGFAWTDVIDFVGVMIKLLIGAGLGVLQSTLPWVIVLTIIGVIVGLLYGAFRFFRRA